LPETLSKALKKIAELNPDLQNVVDSVDFIQFTSNRENLEILRQLIELFSEKKLSHVSPDILGDAYEWVLRYFAPNPKPNEAVYDPACGSAGMLIISYNHVKEKFGEDAELKIMPIWHTDKRKEKIMEYLKEVG